MAESRNRQQGQALMETGVVLGIVALIVLGIVEFGYAFFALNMVTNAARDGARAAAALQNRGACGSISDSSSIPQLVRVNLNGIVTVDGAPCCDAGVCVDQCVATSSGAQTCTAPPTSSPCPTYSGTDIPTVRVTVAGHIPFLFGLVGSRSLSFCRTMSFRDEGR